MGKPLVAHVRCVAQSRRRRTSAPLVGSPPTANGGMPACAMREPAKLTCIFDPSVRKTLRAADLHGSDYSVHGWPEVVLLRG